MKFNIKMLLTHTVLLVIICVVPSMLFAQGDPGGDPDVVPVDGGLIFLAAAGVAYSVKKIKDHRNKEKEKQEF